MQAILNLTQHAATPEQAATGVIAASFADRLPSLLTFVGLPSPTEITQRAEVIASLAADDGVSQAMIGGAPFFMAPLEKALRAVGITPLYAFSERASVDSVQPDGSIRKTAEFRHLGFVPAV